ncbi:MAG TPA: hypothetical protein ENN39_08575 [Desulfonatronum sp.]|nr:hypothetical protein [Desulfonatronum sp.]
MESIDAYLDEALDLSRVELSMLAEGDVQQAEILARDRGRLMDMAWRGRNRISQEQFLEKVEQLRKLHDNVQHEARRLHKLLKDDLMRVRKQGQFFTGCRPQASSLTQEARFISKQG